MMIRRKDVAVDPVEGIYPPLDRNRQVCAVKNSAEQSVPGAGINVFIDDNPFSSMWEHITSDHDNEVGGGLIGRYFIDSRINIRFLIINEIIPCMECTKNKYDIVFVAEFFHRLDIAKEDMGDQNLIIGTYHSHPNYSVFLSETDKNTILTIFNRPHHVTLIGDPVRNDIGCFIWYEEIAVRSQFFRLIG